MSTLDNFVSPVLTRALGWTLLHSLWQGALVAAVLAGTLLLLRRHRAEVRYLASAVALGGLVLAAGLTFGRYYFEPVAAASAVTTAAAQTQEVATVTIKQNAGQLAKTTRSTSQTTTLASPAHSVSAVPGWLTTTLHYFERNLPLLVLVWLLGLLAMSLRMLGGLLYVQRLRRYRVKPLGAAWQAKLAVLAERAGLRQPVALLESALVQVPLVVGHVRPVILLPLGAVAGLSPACLEAILAHELAHVLRRDYLVNLLQTVAEVLFFYHPAVWFMASCLRAERENCCDDTATALVGGDPLRLARALTALAEWSQSAVLPVAPRLALAAVGGRGSLLGRVRRLVQRRPAAPTVAEGLMAGALVLCGLGLLGGSVALAGPVSLRSNGFAFKNKQGGVADTTKRGNSLSAATSTAMMGELTAPEINKEITFTDADAAELQGVEQGLPVANDGNINDEQEEAEKPPRSHKNRRVVIQHGPHPAASTVVIEKDKKGRVTDVRVNGQRVETGKAGKVSKGAREVTVLTLPAAPPDRHYTRNSSDFEENMDRVMEQWGREFGEKMSRKMDKVSRKLEKSDRTYVYVDPKGAGRGSRNTGTNVHVDIDDEALSKLANNAVALGNMSINLGLQAAGQGLEEARRGLEAALQTPGLSLHDRREIQRDLAELNSDAADEARDRAEEARDRADDAAEEARDRAENTREAARDRAEDVRERRREIQQRIQEAQRELQELEAAGGTRSVPTPPRLPRAPRAPRAPRTAQAPLAPMAPVPPAPPAPPRDDSGKVRDALRADGLIGKKDKDFLFDLSAAGMTVNGKKQPAATAEKYRQLLGLQKDSKGRQSHVTINSSDSD
jgi:beta-lactamase regulating signal transducer with metallopeptidase domain